MLFIISKQCQKLAHTFSLVFLCPEFLKFVKRLRLGSIQKKLSWKFCFLLTSPGSACGLTLHPPFNTFAYCSSKLAHEARQGVPSRLPNIANVLIITTTKIGVLKLLFEAFFSVRQFKNYIYRPNTNHRFLDQT